MDQAFLNIVADAVHKSNITHRSDLLGGPGVTRDPLFIGLEDSLNIAMAVRDALIRAGYTVTPPTPKAG